MEDKKFAVNDPDFPQIVYDITKEELMQKLRDPQVPTWWKISHITRYADDLIIIMEERWKNEES